MCWHCRGEPWIRLEIKKELIGCELQEDNPSNYSGWPFILFDLFSFAVCLKWIKMRNNGIPCKDLVIDIAVPVMLWENQEALSCGVGSHYTSLLRSFLLFISYKVKNLSKHFLLFIATWIECWIWDDLRKNYIYFTFNEYHQKEH